jgi:hypothetical protein
MDIERVTEGLLEMGQPDTDARLVEPQYGFHFHVARAIAPIGAVFPGFYAIVKAEIREPARKWREQRDYLAKVLEA